MLRETVKTLVLAAGLFLVMLAMFGLYAVISLARPPGGWHREEHELLRRSKGR